MTPEEMLARVEEGCAQVIAAGRTPARARVGEAAYLNACASPNTFSEFTAARGLLAQGGVDVVAGMEIWRDDNLIDAILVEADDGMPFPVTP